MIRITQDWTDKTLGSFNAHTISGSGTVGLECGSYSFSVGNSSSALPANFTVSAVPTGTTSLSQTQTQTRSTIILTPLPTLSPSSNSTAPFVTPSNSTIVPPFSNSTAASSLNPAPTPPPTTITSAVVVTSASSSSTAAPTTTKIPSAGTVGTVSGWALVGVAGVMFCL